MIPLMVHEISQVRILEWVSFPSPANLPDPGIKRVSPELSGKFFTAALPGKPIDIISSVQFSRSVVSDSLQPHELQHTRPPCLSPTPGVYPNSCPLSQWCHPAISFSVIPFSSCSNPSQHQGLFQWVNSSHEVAKVLEFQLQQQSFQWTPRTDLL